MTAIPNGSLYQTIMNSFLDPSYVDKTVGFGTRGDKLWQDFLAQNGLKATDPSVVTEDPTILAEFVSFVQQTSASLQQGKLSPKEMTNRAIMFSVYDLMVLMLSVLQNNVGVTGQNIAFLGHYQDAYAKLLGRLADTFYIGGALSIPVINTSDMSEWTLGYGGINMQDYLSTALTGVPTPSVNGAAGNSAPTYPTLQLNSVNLTYPAPPAGPYSIDQGMIADPLTHVQVTSLVAAGPATTTSYDNLADAAMNTFTISSNGQPGGPPPTQVTFTYKYKQQYDFDVKTFVYDRDSNGVITGYHEVQTVHQTGFYANPPVTYTVNINPNFTPEQQLDQLKTGFLQFLQQPIQNLGYLPPNYTPPGTFDFYFINPKMPYPPTYNVYTSMTDPVTFYNVVQKQTGLNSTGRFDLTATRVLTVPRNSSKDFNPYNRGDTQGNTSYNIPYVPEAREEANIIATNTAQKRANKNNLLQQYITNAQTAKGIIGNQSDAAQSQQSQSQTGIGQAASVLNAVIDQLSTILTSIFNVKK